MKQLLMLRYLWTLPPIFWAAVVGVSFQYNLHTIERQILEQSQSQGRDIFRMVQAMRLWNTQHGGVYVLESKGNAPNPYLDPSKSEVLTQSGERLALITPANMTRQMAETISGEAHIRIRTVGLQPVNPKNAPDEWERESLQAFAAGERERSGFFAVGRLQDFRYMAPLVMETACLTCHVNQGFRVGEIRGGISVGFSAEPILQSVERQKREMGLIHLIAWVVLSALGIFTLAQFRVLVLLLEKARREQESLVEERTAELQSEVRERRHAESNLHYLVDSSAHGMLGVDRSGRVTFCNRQARELLSAFLGDREILGSAIIDTLTLSLSFASDLELAMMGTQTAGRLSVTHPVTGLEHHLEYALNAIRDHGEIIGCVISLTDVTDRQHQEEVIWKQAHFDPLTSLPNRMMFASRMAKVLAPDSALKMAALLFIDLDDFKPVNDQFGHKAGDIVLMEIARRLQQEIRESDFAARLGGDEFVVVLGGVGVEEQVGKITQKLIAHLSQPIDIGDGHSAQVSASVGIAFFPKDGENIETLLRHSDMAMYQAKQKRKGSFEIYQPGNTFPKKPESDEYHDPSL